MTLPLHPRPHGAQPGDGRNCPTESHTTIVQGDNGGAGGAVDLTRMAEALADGASIKAVDGKLVGQTLQHEHDLADVNVPEGTPEGKQVVSDGAGKLKLVNPTAPEAPGAPVLDPDGAVENPESEVGLRLKGDDAKPGPCYVYGVDAYGKRGYIKFAPVTFVTATKAVPVTGEGGALTRIDMFSQRQSGFVLMPGSLSEMGKTAAINVPTALPAAGESGNNGIDFPAFPDPVNPELPDEEQPEADEEIVDAQDELPPAAEPTNITCPVFRLSAPSFAWYGLPFNVAVIADTTYDGANFSFHAPDGFTGAAPSAWLRGNAYGLYTCSATLASDNAQFTAARGASTKVSGNVTASYPAAAAAVTVPYRLPAVKPTLTAVDVSGTSLSFDYAVVNPDGDVTLSAYGKSTALSPSFRLFRRQTGGDWSEVPATSLTFGDVTAVGGGQYRQAVAVSGLTAEDWGVAGEFKLVATLFGVSRESTIQAASALAFQLTLDPSDLWEFFTSPQLDVSVGVTLGGAPLGSSFHLGAGYRLAFELFAPSLGVWVVGPADSAVTLTDFPDNTEIPSGGTATTNLFAEGPFDDSFAYNKVRVMLLQGDSVLTEVELAAAEIEIKPISTMSQLQRAVTERRLAAKQTEVDITEMTLETVLNAVVGPICEYYLDPRGTYTGDGAPVMLDPSYVTGAASFEDLLPLVLSMKKTRDASLLADSNDVWSYIYPEWNYPNVNTGTGATGKYFMTNYPRSLSVQATGYFSGTRSAFECFSTGALSIAGYPLTHVAGTLSVWARCKVQTGYGYFGTPVALPAGSPFTYSGTVNGKALNADGKFTEALTGIAFAQNATAKGDIGRVSPDVMSPGAYPKRGFYIDALLCVIDWNFTDHA